MYVEHEHPYQAIIDAANNQHCDLIVMASHGQHRLSAILLGSVTVKVLTHSTIPSLSIVRGNVVENLRSAPHHEGETHMQYRSVCLALSFGELTPTPVEESRAAENYAIAFCSRERAHLSVFMAAPNLRIPSAGFFRSPMRSLMRSMPSAAFMPKPPKRE